MTSDTPSPSSPLPPPHHAGRPGRRRRAGRSRRGRWATVPVLVVVVIVLFALANRYESGQAAASPRHALGPADSEIEGSRAAKVLVEEYGDYQCPYCHQFHTNVGPALTAMLRAGNIRFAFHPYAFIGPESVAAASAAECAGDEGRYFAMFEQLYNHEWPENSGAITTDQLVTLARAAGVSRESTLRCIRSGRYEAWVRRVTEEGSARGVTGTPTVFVNGSPLTDTSLAAFQDAVRQAGG